MDPLRLLARSTNLQSKHAGCPVGQFPSGGSKGHPQRFMKDASSNASGRKRKREDTALRESGVEKPDLFSSYSKPMIPETNSSAKGEKSNRLDDENIQIMSQEERVQILRLHKINVHKLEFKRGKFSNEKPAISKTNLAPSLPQPLRAFRELSYRYHFSKRLLRNLEDQGFETPTEVQLASLPLLLGPERNLMHNEKTFKPDTADLLTVAPTGSGKTLAFLVPIIHQVVAKRHEEQSHLDNQFVTAIVLAPTHELVEQIVNEGRKWGKGTGVKIVGMRKGMIIEQGASSELSGEGRMTTVNSDVLVSTPALLSNMLNSQNSTHPELPKIEHLVLDEADVLLDPHFQNDVMRVWNACVSPSLRSSLWSATMGASIESLALECLSKRSEKSVSQNQPERSIVRVVAGLKDSVITNVTHDLVYTANEQGKLLAVRQLLRPSRFEILDEVAMRPPFLVFTQTIPRAIALQSELLYDIPAEAGGSSRIAVLHSDLTLNSRADVMTRFRKGEIWILVTTDLLARGIDFRGINGVVNYDMPTSAAGYVHRAGRTGRIGRDGGKCVTFYTKEDVPYIKTVANVISAADKAMGRNPDDVKSRVPQWLLDTLPKLTKETKRHLKRNGVLARRDGKSVKMGRRSQMRISTKSGYERRIEHRIKSTSRPELKKNSAAVFDGDNNDVDFKALGGHESEFDGFED